MGDRSCTWSSESDENTRSDGKPWAIVLVVNRLVSTMGDGSGRPKCWTVQAEW